MHNHLHAARPFGRRSTARLLLAALLLGVLSATPGPVAAQGGSGGLSLTLVTPPDQPPRSFFRYTLAPGGEAADAVDLKNTSGKAVEVRVYRGDCYNGPNGALVGPLYGQPSRQAGTWLSLDADRVQLGPGQGRRVKFSLRVPDGTPPGDYFAFLFVEPETSSTLPPRGTPRADTVFAIDIKQRVGVVIWTRVEGSHTTGLRVENVRKSIQQGQLYVLVDVVNIGNTFLKPSGSWTLKASEGSVVATRPMHEWGYVLPGHPLRVEIPVAPEHPLARGDYVLDLVVRFGEETRSETFPLTLP